LLSLTNTKQKDAAPFNPLSAQLSPVPQTGSCILTFADVASLAGAKTNNNFPTFGPKHWAILGFYAKATSDQFPTGVGLLSLGNMLATQGIIPLEKAARSGTISRLSRLRRPLIDAKLLAPCNAITTSGSRAFEITELGRQVWEQYALSAEVTPESWDEEDD
jgi:hypothetical protein